MTNIKELHVWETRKLEEIRTEKLKDTISNFSEDEKTTLNAYWKIIKATRGKERTKISSLVRNDGVEVFTEESIQHEDEIEGRTGCLQRSHRTGAGYAGCEKP